MKKKLKLFFLVSLCIFIQINSIYGVLAGPTRPPIDPTGPPTCVGGCGGEMSQVKQYRVHTSTGHEFLLRCQICNGFYYGNGKEANPNCLSCTTAPMVTIKNLSSITTLGLSDAVFKLQIDVSDNENDILTCKYYINDSDTPVGIETVTSTNPTKTVTFATGFNVSTLPQGQNKIRVEVKDSIAPAGIAATTFYVDTKEPVINGYKASTTYNSASITVTANDASSPIEYRYTVGTTVTEWLPLQTTYNINNLIPNTAYSYKIEAKDIKGNVSSINNTFTTKAQAPTVSLEAGNNNSIKINISDENPTDTLYKIKIGDKYLSSEGTLSNTVVWMPIVSKTISALNLIGNTEHTVIVFAKNGKDNFEAVSQESRIKTTPLSPSGLNCTNKTNTSISLIWNSSAGAYGYDLLRETIINGAVTEMKHFENILATSYTDTGLLSNQTYRYKLRAKLNSITYGNWSETNLEAITSPNKPENVEGVTAVLQTSDVNLSWTAQTGAVGYEVLINNQQKQYTQTNSINIPFTLPNIQYLLSVRSFNICDANNPTDSLKWSNEGEWSEPLIIYTSANAPNDIVINNTTYENVQFAWDKNNNPESVLYKCELYKGDALITESDEINTNVYSFSGLDAQTQYTVKIWAINSNKIKSINAAEYIFYTKIAPPEAPRELRSSAKDNQITLSWKQSERTKNYIIKRDGVIIADNIIDNKYIDIGLAPDTIYTYDIIASNESGTLSATIVQKTKGEAPAIPTIISHKSSNTSIQINWNEVAGAIGYDIKCDNKIYYNTELDTTFEHKGLTSGSEHTYSVRARNIHNNGEWSAPKTIRTIPAAPIMPDGVKITAMQSQINISWNLVAGADSYVVNVDGNEINGITIPECNYIFDSTVTSESVHFVKIMAVNEGGNSGYTVPQSITLLPNISAPEVTGTVEGSLISISWSSIENAVGYEIEKDYATSTTASAITTTYIDTSSSLTESHTYRVRALFEESVGEWSYAITVKAIPSIPSYVEVKSGQNIITVQWNKCDWANIYELSADGVIIYSGPNTTFTHSSLLDNSTHIYSVRAGNQSGFSDWSTSITATTQKEITSVPQNIKPSGGSQNSVVITWDPIKDAKGYMVKINGGQPQNVNVPIISIDTTPQLIYSVSVAAMLDSEQNVLGEWSPEVTFLGPLAIPGIPILSNITTTEHSVELTWDNVANAQGYELEINNNSIIKVYANIYCDSNIPSITTSSYRIRSFNESGVSNWSGSISATTNETLPGAPINILCKNGVATTGAAINIDWNDVDNAISYEVRDSDGNIYTTTDSSIVIDGLQNGIIYQYQVRAITLAGQGAWSSPVSFVTDIIAPINLVASNTESGGILLKWDSSSGATRYEIEMDGKIVDVTEGTSISISQASRYLTHSFRIRALNTIKTSEWTEELTYNQNIPLQVSVDEGEEFSIIMPVSNVKNINKYNMTIIINTEDLGLIDACEFTPKLDTATTNFENNNMQIIVNNVNNLCYISMIINNGSPEQITGIINSIRLYGKRKCIAEIKYSVSIFR